MDKIVITIARYYGSGGKTIGEMLGEELGIPFYNREILRMASDDSGTYLVVINQNGHVVFSPMTDGIFAVLSGNESHDLCFRCACKAAGIRLCIRAESA